ncbi:cell division protein FtsX [Clostridium acidisoli DSM 12555]|jgi:cell division transport system permease protein|uniref:Cell division protein FtsX n=1 Tax=Clostridium acidisoli DSM 12555 TaxID=1121291 RepID=A0A1W1XHQ1_9CLOT|nr:permease-like cell division protein FtsX [Clostridium acidisoli]SMC23304.1 cell division protein FtsX [Clostridium acidisoli DSM 12555]
MKPSTIKLFIVDALKSLRRNKTISIASIATVMATLFVLGAFVMILLNVKVGITDVESQVEAQVFLNDDIKIDDQKSILDKLNKTPEIVSISFQTKSQALDQWKKELGSKNKELLSGMEENNPLPNAYIVKVKNPEDITKVESAMKGAKGIYEISDGRDIVNKISAVTKTIQWVGIILFLILIGVSLFLISNTIKLTVYARRREIGIMKYIGATDWFIRWPFIIEGMVIGLFGAIVADIAIYYAYVFIYGRATSFVSMMINLVSPMYFVTNLSWAFILGGIFIGALGSILSIRKFLIV